MPELPEVETVARGLAKLLPGRRIESLRLGKTDFIEDHAALERELPGSRISSVSRYGKFLLFTLERDVTPAARNGSGSAGKFFLLIHLGMTGQLTARRADETAPAHTHVFLKLDDGTELRYTDTRRFGRMLLVAAAQRDAVLGRLGLDPLEASAEAFGAQLTARRARIKALLLDQRVFRGLGNIYTDESLWRARIHPLRQAAKLKAEEAARLHRAVQAVLEEAISLRGSSVSDYLDAQGRPGEYQRRHRVYQREGKKCFRCGAVVRRTIVAGRSSFYCPRCQPAPRQRRQQAQPKTGCRPYA